jgi:antirestriction protein ArdC
MTFRRKPVDKPRRDVAAEITSLIIQKLESGVLPWSRPWGLTGAGGRPLRHCGTPYTGINNLYLWAIGDARGYSARTWMTYRQAEELGGHVRRGEHGSHSVYFSSFSKTETDRVTGEEANKNIRFLRSYTVFNVEQIDGLPVYFYPVAAPPEPRVESVHRAAIDGFFDALPATVRHGGDQAFFSPIGDYIQMPHRTMFRSDDHYASTLGHEYVHYSGAQSRLNREFGKKFGDQAYAFEELVASIGQCLICADLGLPGELHDNHASYIDHWLRILKGDSSAIIKAASKAEQAVAWLRDAADEEGQARNMQALAA